MSNDRKIEDNQEGTDKKRPGSNDETSQSAPAAESGEQGRASYHPGSTTQGGSNFGQGSSHLGGESYHQGDTQNDGANYENEYDGIARAGTDNLRQDDSRPQQPDIKRTAPEINDKDEDTEKDII